MTNHQPIHIALISNNLLFLAGIKSILHDKPAFQVISETNNIQDVMDLSQLQLDVILVSQELIENSSTQEIEQLLDTFPGARLAMLVSDSEHLRVETVLLCKVSGYLTNDMSVESLITAIQTVHQGKYWFSPDMMQKVIASYKQLLTKTQQKQATLLTPPPKHLISRREYDVLQYLAKGYENREISAALGINESTVKNHIASMFKKNNVNARTPLVLKAIKNHWLQIDGGKERSESDSENN